MAGNWGFVAAAYGLSAIVLLGYWRRLARRERDIAGQRRGHGDRRPGGAR